jgi:LAO/AO transport system kinase
METHNTSALRVQAGIEQPSQINPYLKKNKINRPAILSKQAYVDGILSQNIMVLSQAITLIESNLRKTP